MRWWRANAQHVARFGHVPVWRQFDRVAICERCIKPPRRGRLIPVSVLSRMASGTAR